MDFSSLGKIFLMVGLIIAGLGFLMVFSDKVPWIGRLPGDIFVRGKYLSFYFPLTTCIIISVLLSLILFFFRHK